MRLVREFNKTTNEWEFWAENNWGKLGRTHPMNEDCETYGCVLHNPTRDWPLADAPYNWRIDRSIMERMCVHGVGHPDIDSARFMERSGRAFENVHGCDGCC